MNDTKDCVFISTDRYERLIKSEHDANQLKALIKERYDSYGTFDREDLKFLYFMFIGKEEE